MSSETVATAVKYFTVQNTTDRDVANFEHNGLLWTIGAWKVNDLPSDVAEAMEKAYPQALKIVDREYKGTPNTVVPINPKTIKNSQEGDAKPPPLDWSKEWQTGVPPQVAAEIGLEQNVSYDCANCGASFPQHSLFREHLNVHAAPPVPPKSRAPRRSKQSTTTKRAERLATKRGKKSVPVASTSDNK